MAIQDLKELQKAIEDKIHDHFKGDAFDVHYYDRSPHAEIPANGETVSVPFVGYCNGKKRREGESLEFCAVFDADEKSRLLAIEETLNNYRLSTKTVKMPGAKNNVRVIWRETPTYVTKMVGFYVREYAIKMRLAVVRITA